MGGRQRLVPIVDKDLVVGVVTRTDLINVMTSEPGQVLDYQENNSRERNVSYCVTVCPHGCAICWSWRAVWGSG